MRKFQAPILGVLLALLTSATLAEEPSTTPTEPKPLYWRQNVFAIPFEVAEKDAVDGPAEVQLFVSSDQGQTWEFAQAARPDQQRFVQQVSRDGEYWFSLRTKTVTGKLTPDAPHSGDLRVKIDTAPPAIDLVATTGESGEVKLNWNVADPHLDPQSLVIEYRPTPEKPWRPLALEVADNAQDVVAGEQSWWPSRPVDSLTFRATALDRAGNRTVTQAQARYGQETKTAANTAAKIQDAGHTRDQETAAPESEERYANTGAAQKWPVDSESSVPLGTKADHIELPTTDTFATPERQPVKPQVESFASTTRPSAPAGEVQWINNRAFQMEYDAQHVHASAEVELWMTADGGETWNKSAVDHDKQSPLLVNVPRDGEHGFRIVIRNGIGPSAQPPAAGDQPEMLVHVDTRPPTAAFENVQLGEGEQAGHMLIEWTVEDRNPVTNGTSLFYSGSPGGPWTPLAASLENTGNFTWPLAHDVPNAVFFRLEARDRAGNVASTQTERPVRLQRSVARIRGVRSVEYTASENVDRR